MKHKPILFSAEMVRALLEGRKTMTRRIVKDRHGNMPEEFDSDGWPLTYCGTEDDMLYRASCPHGLKNDYLWVRESWHTDTSNLNDARSQHEDVMSASPIYYKADRTDTENYQCGFKFKPSIHMPKWASRLTLKITDVRVERVRDISHEDMIKEGLSTTLREHDAVCDLCEQWESLWTKINGADSWNSNPWAWVIEFEVIHRNVLVISDI